MVTGDCRKMISGATLLLLLISAVSAGDADAPVTDCDACSKDSTCQSSQDTHNATDVTPTCSCTDGFVGNGVFCYNRTACDGGICCGSGYRWSPERGCVDIDECASSEKACDSLVCENTPGSFDCWTPDPEPSRAPGSHRRVERSVSRTAPQHSVVFRCGGVMCPAGQDCITVNGLSQCRDPCAYYSALNDAWRSTSYRHTYRVQCDARVSWQGWYRLFLGGSSVQMPERCVPKLKCGTHIPLWLPDGHPAPSDGIVSSPVCGHWSRDCCLVQSYRIHIKACPRNYFVYKFVRPPGCHYTYCADDNTAVCGTCRPDETCVSEDKVNWRCERQEPQAPELVCGRRFMQVRLDKADLAGKGLNASSAHLADFRCTAHNESGDVVWFQMERKARVCGTQLRTNDTHAMYSNTLFVYPVTNGNVSFSIPERFPITCVYPLDTNTSLDMDIRPHLSVEDAEVRMGPRPRAVMSLYHNANYTDPYSEGAVVLPLGSALYVGVSAEEAASDRFAVVLENCYATPSADPGNPVRFFLIQNRCPSNRRLVKVEQSGPSLPGRFTALVSLFSSDYDSIFLHCSLTMCDPKNPSCSQTCRSRVSRSVSLENPVTIGPITINFGEGAQIGHLNTPSAGASHE